MHPLIRVSGDERGSISCLEEMEQAQEVRGQERVEARVEEKVAKAGEVVLRQDRVGIVSVRTAVNVQPINWDPLVLSRNVPSVERQ